MPTLTSQGLGGLMRESRRYGEKINRRMMGNIRQSPEVQQADRLKCSQGDF